MLLHSVQVTFIARCVCPRKKDPSSGSSEVSFCYFFSLFRVFKIFLFEDLRADDVTSVKFVKAK